MIGYFTMRLRKRAHNNAQHITRHKGSVITREREGAAGSLHSFCRRLYKYTAAND